MAREVRTERRGVNPVVVILLFLFGVGLMVAVLFLVHLVNPLWLPQVFGSPDAAANARLTSANQELSAQNGNLSAALNETQAANGNLRAALAKQRSEEWIPVLVITGVVIIAVLVLWAVFRHRQDRGLTLAAAIAYGEPIARLRFGFPDDYFGSPVVTARAFERLKHQGETDGNEYMYFIEYQFPTSNGRNRFYHGLHGHASTVVTFALTSKTYEHRQQWFPWMKVDQAIARAHEMELWGFGLQKTKREEDFLNAVENARSFREIQKEYASEDSGGDS